MHRFLANSELPASAEHAWDWHVRPGAFERLAPPWDPVETVGVEWRRPLVDGTRRELRLRFGPASVPWIAVHEGLVRGRQFVDRQERGPFGHWEHVHAFEPLSAGACRLEDRIAYEPPSWAPDSLAAPATDRRLRRMFRYRHDQTRADLERHARFRERGPLAVAITGASGLVGRALAALLEGGGHRVVRVVRRTPAGLDEISWDPAAGAITPADWEGLDAVVHLAGESIASGRWTAARKRAIRDSRVGPSALLARTLAGLSRPPRVLVQASAIGFYGDRGDEELDERAIPGEGFLPGVSVHWEDATASAANAGIRVVLPRIGVVLTPAGGALARMLPPMRAGLGGTLGSGRQWMSWISLDDLIGLIHEALFDERMAGPINAVAPEAVDNRRFTEQMAGVLGRPAFVPAPAVALRLALGEMADALLLASTRVVPARLTEIGFPYRHPRLEDALRHVLGRHTNDGPVRFESALP